MDSSSSAEEDFEGFVVSLEEKLSYKVWTRKRRASEAFNNSSADDPSGDEEFEGFVVSPEEKLSYKAWTKKRSLEAFNDGSDDDLTGDDNSDDDDDEEDDDEDNLEEDDDDDDDDDDEDGNESFDEGEENEELVNPVDEINIEESGDEMSSGNTDQCPVCLMSLKEQLLGTPNNCTHVFCFECIQEWAKNATTCPVGRKPFNEILVHATKKGPVLQRIPVEERQAGHDEEEEDDPTYCEVCGECNREDRMLLCDGCDSGYHMDCLTPPVEFVPLEEWFCPSCSSHQEEEVQEDDQPREVTRACNTRGRPRRSTARHVSGSHRTGTTRTARTVASIRGRGRTVRGQGRGRRRSGSRGRGREGRSSSTRGRLSLTRKTRRRKKSRSGSSKNKKVRSSSTKRSKKTSKRTTRKSTKKRRVAKEEEVSPFIYEPKRRGKTVHARLLESLSAPGPSTEPSRSTSIGRIPFPNRVEPSSSFSLFGNAFALHDFDEQNHDIQETTQRVEQATAWSSESDNPDVLGSIFQGLQTLHSPSTQLSRGGKLLATVEATRVEGTSIRSAGYRGDSASNLGDKNLSEKEKNEKSFEEKKPYKEEGIISKGSNNANVSSIDNPGPNGECSPRRSVENRSKMADTASCSEPTEIIHPLSPPLKPVSSKSTLYAFRIPKRCLSRDFQNESRQVTSGMGVGSTSDKHDQVFDCSISKFKIPKRTNSCGDDSSKNNCKATMENSDTTIAGQRLATSSKNCKEQRVVLSNFTSPNKGLPPSTFGATTAQSSSSGFNSVRPVLRKNLEQNNARNLSTAKKANISYSSSLSRCHASKINSIPHRYNSTPSTFSSGPVNVTHCQIPKSMSSCHAVSTTTSSIAGRETKSINMTTCHAKNSGDGHFPPLTEEAPFMDNSKPVKGKEQRRSNIEILKMLQEKQRSMREQMLDDPKGPPSVRRRSSDEVHVRLLSSQKTHSSDESPVCSRGFTLPVAVVKPSPHISSSSISSSAAIPSVFSESSPVKSIASGIIDAHSSYSHGLKRIHSGFHARPGDKLSKRGQCEKAAGANSDRDHQRKLGIARLQRHQQIMDEVKLALKPFYRQRKITKDDYKVIMKKSVEKIEESNSSVDRDRVGRLVKKYVHKIKGVNISVPP